jgi:hypothetical protein
MDTTSYKRSSPTSGAPLPSSSISSSNIAACWPAARWGKLAALTVFDHERPMLGRAARQ